MLASITPLGERGRQARWPITLAAFVLGNLAAGCAAGALAGGVGDIVLPVSFGGHLRLLTLATAALVSIVLDAGPVALPGPRRQVDERWLDRYRGWAYGLGYGLQLGLGVTTVVTSAATYIAIVAACLTATAAGGALILGCFGAARGLTLLAGAHVRTPQRLIALHAWLERRRRLSGRAGLASLTAIFLLAATGGLG
ncbi:MAG: hypothetical protein ACR2IP_13780 [Solirubrobacteraceae bacterium]